MLIRPEKENLLTVEARGRNLAWHWVKNELKKGSESGLRKARSTKWEIFFQSDFFLILSTTKVRASSPTYYCTYIVVDIIQRRKEGCSTHLFPPGFFPRCCTMPGHGRNGNHIARKNTISTRVNEAVNYGLELKRAIFWASSLNIRASKRDWLSKFSKNSYSLHPSITDNGDHCSVPWNILIWSLFVFFHFSTQRQIPDRTWGCRRIGGRDGHSGVRSTKRIASADHILEEKWDNPGIGETREVCKRLSDYYLYNSWSFVIWNPSFH